MSTKQYFDQLVTSGADFMNSSIAETDFLDEKKMEIDILGLTDESINSDGSIYDADFEDDEGRSIYETSIEKTNLIPDNNLVTSKHLRSVDQDELPSDMLGSAPDDMINKSLYKSQNKEVLVFTDTESEDNIKPKMTKPVGILKSTIKSANSSPNDQIDLDSDSESSDVSVIDTNRKSVTFQNVQTERKRMEDIMNSEIAEIKELESTINKQMGILSSQWDEDWDRVWGDGNVLNNKKGQKQNAVSGKESLDRQKSGNSGSIYASRVYTDSDSDFPQFASYMRLEPKKEEVKFNLFDLIKEFFVVMLLHLYLGITNAMFNVISIDGIVSCIIFYMASLGISKAQNFLDKIRLITIDRYIYYLILFVGVHIVNYVSWFQFPEVTRYMASFMICPSIMAQIYQYRPYAKIRQVLYDGYNNLIKKIICKQLAKIINMFIEKVLVIEARVTYSDLMVHYMDFDFVVINKFIVTFILALIFNHIDKGSLRFPIMIYKTFYMKDAEYNIRDDRQYLTAIIKDQKWEKFLNVYTLNRMIRMLIENDDKDADLSVMIMDFLKRQLFRFNRVMFCWSIMSLTKSLFTAILGFLLFIRHSEKRLQYLLNILIFLGVSMLTEEKILSLFICELSFPIIESKLIFDVTNDIYASLKRGIQNILENTRAESICFSILLSTLSFFGLNTVAMGVVIIINLILILRFRNSDLNVGEVRMIKIDKKSIDKKNDSNTTTDPILETRDMTLSDIRNYLSMISNLQVVEVPQTVRKEENSVSYSINKSSDVILYITRMIQNNLLYKTMISSAVVDKFDLYRMYAIYFSVLVFGYISGFAVIHMLFLPTVIQNIVDIIWSP